MEDSGNIVMHVSFVTFFGHQDAKVLAKNKNTDHTRPIWTTAQ
jgi:hypothetical protein